MQFDSKLFLAAAFAAGFLSSTIAFTSSQALLETPLFQTHPGYCAYSVEAIFSPGAQDRLLEFVSSARETLDVMLYQFSNPALKQALVEAAAGGVAVRIILEPRVSANYATAEFLASKGVQVRFASKEYTNTHAKSAVADAKLVLVGSINWSRQAMRSNRESNVIVESFEIAREFLEVFEQDWAKAKDFVPPAQ